jgi:SNF2 family DNA or RNA helicase
MAQVANLIGTAQIDESDPTVLKCRASIPNIRRLKRIFPRAKQVQDDDTKAAIALLKEAENNWVIQSEHMRAAKAGREEDLGYEFKFTPYTHQRRGFYFMHASPRSAIFGDCGIGKTAIAASFIESLVEKGEPGPALVICPISIIKQAWLKDIEKFTKLRAVSIYEPSSYKTKQKRLQRLETDADVYIASFSLVRIMEKELRKKRFRTIIVDESTKIKNPQSRTFRSLKEISWKADRRYVMSGTPAPNGPLDLWSQFYFVDEGMTLEPSIVDFRHEYFTRISVGSDGAGFWVPKRNMARKIYTMIEPRSIRFKSSECLDLPEQTFVIRECGMNKEQARVYNDMVEHLFVQLEDGETVTARIALSRLMKLREITGGFVITDRGEPKEIGKNPKACELDDLLEQIMASEEHKGLIWIQYRWEARTLIQRYRKKYGAAGLYGDLSQGVKDANIDRFLEDPKSRLLICHPQSAAHGLTLTVASYSIYYSLSHNFEEYYQSSKRIHRPGQKRPTFYYFLVCENTVDQSLLTCIQDKKNMQDLLIDGRTDPRSLVGIRK